MKSYEMLHECFIQVATRPFELLGPVQKVTKTSSQ